MSASVISNVELCMWNLPDAGNHPNIGRVRAALVAQNLDERRAADIPASTAFRRAADDLRDKSTLVRPFERKLTPSDERKTLCVQVDREETTDKGLDRHRVGVYHLVETDDAPPHVSMTPGADLDTYSNLREKFYVAQDTYTWSDLSKVLQTIMMKDGLGAYSPRKSGGVYFVPVPETHRDLLTRIERFAEGFGVRFLRYTVPDTQAQRAEVADALAIGVSADLDEHTAAVASYTETTKPGIITNRLEALDGTAKLIERLGALLGSRAIDLAQRINTIKTAAEAALTVANNSRPVASRRVVQTA